MSTNALYPGTFDPITLGHQDIITRASKFCDTLYIGVAIGHHKNTLFSLEERHQMVQTVINDMQPACQIMTLPYDGLLVDLCHQHQIDLIIRGVRSVSDFEYEHRLAAMNRHLASDIETIFLTPTEQFSFLSSTLAREAAKLGGDISRLLHPKVKEKLINKVSQI